MYTGILNTYPYKKKIPFVDSLSTPISPSEPIASRTVKSLYRDCKDQKGTLVTTQEKRTYICCF